MPIVIALDAMGGDFGPSVTVEGADLALTHLGKQHEEAGSSLGVRFLFFGERTAVQTALEKFPRLQNVSEVVSADVIITNDMKPLDALRHRDDSNLGLALKALAEGRAQAVVSAANTGAYVSLAKVILGTLPGIDRPAIPAMMPNSKGHSVVLDLGANLECTSERLTQFALMGEVLARTLLRKETPTVGLLNVGSEEMKGNPIVQWTSHQLRAIDEKTQESPDLSRFHFYGFVEGNDIFRGVTDVVVTDGFSGNIALKSIEGAILFFFELIKRAGKASLLKRIAALFTRFLLKGVKRTIDPRLYNGAVFLGLKKVVVKSHGNADAFGFSQAVLAAVDMARASLPEAIERRLSLLTEVEQALKEKAALEAQEKAEMESSKGHRPKEEQAVSAKAPKRPSRPRKKKTDEAEKPEA